MVRAMHQFAESSSVAACEVNVAKPARRPFVAINCGGMSADLLASELFGYADGAFTGARRGGMTGKVEAAHGGTLFLDEIGEMPLALQPHLLRVLEEGEIYRIGETTPRKIQFKLIAATHRNLQREVAEGRFREDLYYRISVTSIQLPPLREMAEDIPLLARHLLQRLCSRYDAGPKTIADDAMRYYVNITGPAISANCAIPLKACTSHPRHPCCKLKTCRRICNRAPRAMAPCDANHCCQPGKA